MDRLPIPPSSPHDAAHTSHLAIRARADIPIYREVVMRVLGRGAEEQVTTRPRAFVLSDGRLAFRRMMRAFAKFWREHGEILATRMPYPEAGPQLVLMAFMQRVVNGGGYIDREYGIGRKRMDLLVRYPYSNWRGEPTM